MVNFGRLCFWSVIFLYLCAVTYFVGARDLSVGADSERYAEYFQRVLEDGYHGRYEPLFIALTYFLSLVSGSTVFYFAMLFLIFSLFYFMGVDSYARSIGFKSKDYLFLSLFLAALCLSSSWYFTASTNALRHGLSLTFLYAAIFSVVTFNYMRSLVFFVCSLGFHYSSILAVPFICLLRMSFRKLLILFFALCIGYPTGLNEVFVKLVSDGLGLGIYEKISGYVEEEALWVGFQWDFYIYSVFWIFAFWGASFFIKEAYTNSFITLLKIYMCLLMPYMVFGFGGFSNRYAFFAWLFLPVIQSFGLTMLRFCLAVKLCIALVALVSGAFIGLSRFGFIE